MMSGITAPGQRLAERARALPVLAVDGVIAALSWLILLFQAGLDNRLDGWIALLTAVNAVPLLWRRRYPFAVTALTGIATSWLAIVDNVSGHIPAPQLVATYTFAALCPLLKRTIAAVATVGGIVFSILIPDDSALNFGVIGIAFAVAYALGTSSRARRDRIAMLEERAHRLAEEQDAAATRERERIAREMHDILAHSMSLVVIQAEAGPVAVRTDPDRAEAAFDTISETARDALAQLRRVLGVLRSGDQEREPQPGLDQLPALVSGVQNGGLTASLEQDGRPRPIPADLATTVYRIIQESLTNTVKHANASTVVVRLSWRPQVLRLEIHDDGRPDASRPNAGRPDPGRHGDRSPGNGRPRGASTPLADHSGGHGLIGMRERAAAVGGELIYGPASTGQGFRVAATLPLD